VASVPEALARVRLVPSIKEFAPRLLFFVLVYELKQGHRFSFQGTGCSAENLVLGVAILL
jgi:hypothetical protein